MINARFSTQRVGHKLFIQAVLVLIATSMCLSIAGCVREQAISSLIISGTEVARANQLYENGAYEEAAFVYQTLIGSGVEDGVVYYNLGNAYFKQNDLGRAILNYRRAQQLLPRDPDIASNLELARAQTRDRIDLERNGFVAFVANVMTGWTTVNEVAAVALGIWVALCVCVIIMLRWYRLRSVLGWVSLVLLIGLGLSLLSMGIRIADAKNTHAVIVSPRIEVHSGPGTDYLAEFNLHSGTEVRVIEQRSDWVRISLPGNLQGWVPQTSIEEL